MSCPTLVEYARHHGLTVNPSSLNPLTFLKELCPLPILGHDTSQLSEPDFTVKPKTLQEDKLQISPEATTLLSECMRMSDLPPVEDYLPTPSRKGSLRMELPMLISDHIKDMRWFRKRLDLDKMLEVCKESPLASKEQGFLDITEEAEATVRRLENQLANERLHIKKDVVSALTEYVQDSWSIHDDEEFLRRELIQPKVLVCLIHEVLISDNYEDQPWTTNAPVDPENGAICDRDWIGACSGLGHAFHAGFSRRRGLYSREHEPGRTAQGRACSSRRISPNPEIFGRYDGRPKAR